MIQLVEIALIHLPEVLLNLLVHCGEICVCNIEEILQMPQSKVSRHLAYLRRAELLDFRREGKWVYYRLARQRSRLARKLVHCVKACLSEVEMLQKDLHRFQVRLCHGSCR
jgi:ArsR family transcriptional regulator